MNPNGTALSGHFYAVGVGPGASDLLTLRAGEEIEGDLLGTAVIAVVVALMPLVAPSASWISDGTGVLAGLLIGLPLALAGER